MTDFTDLAQRYIAAFNESDDATRHDRIAGLFTPEATYTDPMAAVAGHDGIAGFVGAARTQLAGFEFRLLGPVDAHHDQARFRWEAGPTEVLDGPGDAPVIGFDVVVAGDDGRIAAVHGFLDAVPAA
ncbi:nuclear transport factor 2 family protein [Pseudonocardia endophytica]|uniref:SnoaL-like protein n=1 Tax=Pseudonocardia endophytica TaxID=401976 RepID=A0A4R1HUC6_PSEEN|nr:nuclear transport factor 2 family protein [Pseudonocardia endophytica]TCK21042.1 SnoaL-like protein [Pseudonocardia endophytica]